MQVELPRQDYLCQHMSQSTTEWGRRYNNSSSKICKCSYARATAMLGQYLYLHIDYRIQNTAIFTSSIKEREKKLLMVVFTEDGRSMIDFYYCFGNHQSGLQSNTFSKLSYIFLIHQNVPQIMSFPLRYMMVLQVKIFQKL